MAAEIAYWTNYNNAWSAFDDASEIRPLPDKLSPPILANYNPKATEKFNGPLNIIDTKRTLADGSLLVEKGLGILVGFYMIVDPADDARANTSTDPEDWCTIYAAAKKRKRQKPNLYKKAVRPRRPAKIMITYRVSHLAFNHEKSPFRQRDLVPRGLLPKDGAVIDRDHASLYALADYEDRTNGGLLLGDDILGPMLIRRMAAFTKAKAAHREANWAHLNHVRRYGPSPLLTL